MLDKTCVPWIYGSESFASHHVRSEILNRLREAKGVRAYEKLIVVARNSLLPLLLS
jgi:hypothetical protein